jgi:CRISPR-associated protein Cmr4
MAGPLWITSPTALQDLANTGLVPQDALNLRVSDNGKRLQTAVRKGKLNLGWLLLDVAEASAPLGPTGADALRKQGVPNEVLSHLALVPDTLFSHLVNSNLEVRTSTAINPLTGATLRGALFTYEAIPRGTLLWFSAVYKNPKDFLLDGQPLTQDLAWVKDNVEKGLRYIEHLGLGGMVSRGMGRARIVNL